MIVGFDPIGKLPVDVCTRFIGVGYAAAAPITSVDAEYPTPP